MYERAILHSDMNCFYASVETMLHPELRGKAVAVCGSTEDRHGIVLAKSELAKKAGVKTGQANWEARQICPNLICVPPDYDQYLKYSKLAKAIYQRYTDLIEPFGMDECWLDVSGSRSLGTGPEIAESIRETIKEELGLTVSIGVSFCKVFAKLGSDMRKPDAVTVLDESNWRDRIWPLDVSEILYCGRATTRKLYDRNIHTIGDLAHMDVQFLKSWFGVNGVSLWLFANGKDTSRVMHRDYESPVKSVGHGITTRTDIKNGEDIWKIMLELAQDIGHRLRIHNLSARGVQITVKDCNLDYRQYQSPLPFPSQSPMEIAQQARILFVDHYKWRDPVRAVTVRAINLISHDQSLQLDMFDDAARRLRREKLEDTIDELRGRFGNRCIYSASLMGDLKMVLDGTDKVKMPGLMYR